ncbi:MAG: SMC-Scp complex subunit ScpB, partial [Thermoguttaceae bacterium]
METNEDQILSLELLREALSAVDDQEPEEFDWNNFASAEGRTKKRAKKKPKDQPQLAIFDESSGETGQDAFFSDIYGEENYSEEQDDQDDNFFEDDFQNEQYDSDSSDFSEDEFEEPQLSDAAEQHEQIELTPLSILEAMLFVGDKENRPLTAERASELMRNVTPEEVQTCAQVLNQRYQAWNCPYEIIEENEGFRLCLREDFESIRTKFYGRIKEARLSQSAIDVLSVVAYKQPITSEEVEKILKQPSTPILSQLVRRELLS